MVINSDVQDLINYPGTVKRVTLDLTSIVPTGQEGDEKMTLLASTSAYSDVVDRTAIQSMYIMDSKVGWAKSSGFTGAGGRFTLDGTHYKLNVRMDTTVSGTAGGFYEIDLEQTGLPISGEEIAADIQTKLRAIECVVGDTGYQLAYLNCSVSFAGGRFIISSGTIGTSYTDVSRSSVDVQAGTTMDCSTVLGFDHQITSQEMDSVAITEALVTVNYTAGDATLTIGITSGVSTGDSLYITDGSNIDYFTVRGVADGVLDVPSTGTEGYIGITNDYLTADGSYIQVLKKQDPEPAANSYFDDVDGLLRYMNKCIINQIDFSG